MAIKKKNGGNADKKTSIKTSASNINQKDLRESIKSQETKTSGKNEMDRKVAEKGSGTNKHTGKENSVVEKKSAEPITPPKVAKESKKPVKPKVAKEKKEVNPDPIKAVTPKNENQLLENPVKTDTALKEKKSSSPTPSEKKTKAATEKKSVSNTETKQKDVVNQPETSSSTTKKPSAKKKATKKAAVAKQPEKAQASEKPVAQKVEKKSSAKSVAKSKNKAKGEVQLSFVLRFHTKPGQSIFISGNHELLGNNDLSMALPLEYLDQDAWKASLEINPASLPKEGITYNYVLKDRDGSLSLDWGTDKVLDPAELTSKEVVFIDSWNFAGYFENVFYTEPFQKILLEGNLPAKHKVETTNYTHVFRVKTPLLKKTQSLCLVGNWNNWDEKNPAVMSVVEGKDYFEVRIDLSKVIERIIYKYGIYDTVSKKLINFEKGENRILNPPTPSVKTIINDGFALLPAPEWKGAGVTLPVFSLLSAKSEGIGDFSDIKLLADWAKVTGLKLIQLLPVNDTTSTFTWKDSYPYGTISSFALHPVYVRLKELVTIENQSILEPYIKEFERLNKLATVDYESVLRLKWEIIKKVYPLQKKEVFNSDAYKKFFEKNKDWLVPYAAFCYFRDKYNTPDFTKWPSHSIYHATETSQILNENSEHFEEAAIHLFVQYYLHLQLKEAAGYSHKNGIILKGDIPIGISRNGTDAWQHPDLFNMNLQAGAPPDDFANSGQNWGFPTYNWEAMQQNGFEWWRNRFDQMSNYFDSFRIDHILGFFRMWSIPYESLEGIMGHFEPAIPIYLKEFYERNIWFDYTRYCLPFINHQLLTGIFGDQTVYVKNQFLDYKGNDHYEFKEAFNSQRKIAELFEQWEQNAHNNWLKYQLIKLLGNVILFEVKGSNGQEFHFRFDMDKTASYQWLDEHSKYQLKELYINYYFNRQDDFWLHLAMQKLPPLKRETDMMVCGEDLGLVPACVPVLMHQLGILSLEIQRMPKTSGIEFFNPANAPYLSVVMPSTHDMSTIRVWWEEDRERTQRFYNEELNHPGYPPYYCDAWVNKEIVVQHLNSPAIWSIFQLQDLFGINRNIRRLDPHEERINDPSVSNYYWNYRIHLTLEKLLETKEFNDELKEILQTSGRA